MFVKEIKQWFKNRFNNKKRTNSNNTDGLVYPNRLAGATYDRYNFNRNIDYEREKHTGALYQDVWVMGEPKPRRKLIGYTDEEIRDYFITCPKEELPSHMFNLRPLI
jgi:hypothetical protein